MFTRYTDTKLLGGRPHHMEPLRTEVGGWRNCSRKTFPISSQSIYFSPHKQTCSLLQAVHWRMTKWIYFLEVFHLLNKQGCIKSDLSLRWIEDFSVRVWKLLFIERGFIASKYTGFYKRMPHNEWPIITA